MTCLMRLPYLETAEARDLFESAMERVRVRFELAIFGYVVMPGHVHLLVSEPRAGSLAEAIQALKLSVAKRRTERPFWLTRYYNFNVWSAEKETEKLGYIHRNPVKRSLVVRPEEWKWSSYRHYQTGVKGTVEVESFRTGWRREHPVSL